EEVQAMLKRFPHVTVIHGHTHQMLTNRIGNIHFHGMLSTAWPWPYAPEGLPKLTIQMNRPDPFNPNDGCGNGAVSVQPAGLVDAVYNLWNRNPIQVSAAYVASAGTKDAPPKATLASFCRGGDDEPNDAAARRDGAGSRRGAAGRTVGRARRCARDHGRHAVRQRDQDHGARLAGEDARGGPGDRGRSDVAVAAEESR